MGKYTLQRGWAAPQQGAPRRPALSNRQLTKASIPVANNASQKCSCKVGCCSARARAACMRGAANNVQYWQLCIVALADSACQHQKSLQRANRRVCRDLMASHGTQRRRAAHGPRAPLTSANLLHGAAAASPHQLSLLSVPLSPCSVQAA